MAKLPSRGVTFKMGATATTQLTEIGGVNISAETLDVTELGDSYRKFISVICDAGETSVSGWYDPDDATHVATYGLLASQVGSTSLQSIVITFTDTTPTTFTADAILTGFEVSGIAIGEAVRFTATFKVSGAWTKA